MNRFNFDCGLPRSGTTLMSAILDQHPDIHASVATPLSVIMQDTSQSFDKVDGYTDVKRQNVLGSMIQNYYSDIDAPLIIDKNRFWSKNIDLIINYIEPEPKILCAVREPLDIIASFISLIESQPETNFVDRYLIGIDEELNTHNRCKVLMQSGGMIYDFLEYLKSAFWCGFDRYFMLIEYDDLTANTEEVLSNVLSFLDAPNYQFDLENVKPKVKEQTDYLAVGLHKVRKKVEKVDRSYKDVLPSRIIKEYQGLAFWRDT